MRVWDYPKDTVVIACDDCGRRGRNSKARFVELVGGAMQLMVSPGSCNRNPQGNFANFELYRCNTGAGLSSVTGL